MRCGGVLVWKCLCVTASMCMCVSVCVCVDVETNRLYKNEWKHKRKNYLTETERRQTELQ